MLKPEAPCYQYFPLFLGRLEEKCFAGGGDLFMSHTRLILGLLPAQQKAFTTPEDPKINTRTQLIQYNNYYKQKVQDADLGSVPNIHEHTLPVKSASGKSKSKKKIQLETWGIYELLVGIISW